MRIEHVEYPRNAASPSVECHQNSLDRKQTVVPTSWWLGGKSQICHAFSASQTRVTDNVIVALRVAVLGAGVGL